MVTKADFDKVRMETERLFPGHHVGFLSDPEDDGVFYIRVYGVADTEVRGAKNKLWDAIDGLEGKIDTNPFIPSIVSLSDTVAFYPEFMPEPSADDVALPASVLSMIKKLRDKHPCGFLSEFPARGLGHPGWNPQLPFEAGDIDSRKESADVRQIRLAA